MLPKYELVNDLEIEPFMQYKLVFAKNPILSCFFFFLIADLYFLILSIIVHICNPNLGEG